MNEAMQKMKEIKSSSKDQKEFLNKLIGQKMVVSMAEGRRVWAHLELKEKNEMEQSSSVISTARDMTSIGLNL